MKSGVEIMIGFSNSVKMLKLVGVNRVKLIRINL